jgi:hypothetical protein
MITRLTITMSCACALALSQNQNPKGQLTERERQMMEELAQLKMRVAALEQRTGSAALEQRTASTACGPSLALLPIAVQAAAVQPPPSSPAGQSTTAASTQPQNVALVPTPADPLAGTTINVALDTYYGYNFNNPIGRANLSRAYDVSSNSFSLSQAAVILENAPDPQKGKRWGLRVDLQFGQATQTLQGNPANEPRPEIYRNIFQAYGTYVVPVGHGLTLDFGKWASSLGIEGNYAKDQFNYSRSFWFNFLPFYHMGLRANYKINDAFAINYWLTNGTQQTEAFNNFKDELFGMAMTPHRNVSWTVNYYFGQEHPDVTFYNNEAFVSPPPPSSLPTLQGVPFEPIVNPPTGHLHIFDTYLTWNVTPRLTLAGEADDVIERLYNNSSPAHTDGGAGYLHYQLTPKFGLAARAEYLSDRGGLFTGVTQALKETTFTLDYKLADGFILRPEWRRDFSNQPYFLTNTLGVLKKEQTTATVGVLWWFGAKQGSW